jgi:hypothetical protein
VSLSANYKFKITNAIEDFFGLIQPPFLFSSATFKVPSLSDQGLEGLLVGCGSFGQGPWRHVWQITRVQSEQIQFLARKGWSHRKRNMIETLRIL